MADNSPVTMALMETLFNHSKTPQFVIDSSLTVTACNPAVNSLFSTLSPEDTSVIRQANMGQDPTTSIHWLTRLAPDSATVFKTAGQPWTGHLFLGSSFTEVTVVPTGDHFVIELVDRSAQRTAENSAASMTSFLQGAGSLVMFTDSDLVITYLNPSLQQILAKYEGELRKVLPSFRADNLLGQCIDSFHANPGHQRALLADPNRLPYKTSIKVGGLEFGLNTAVTVGVDGQITGYATEWFDHNARANYGREVDKVYQACRDGALSVRGDAEELDEVFTPMILSVNEIIDAVVAPISEIRGHLALMAEGDLTAYVDQEYSGDHALLKDALNGTLDSLNDILSKIRQSASQISSGSAQVASSSNSLSEGATRQAAAIEEISASVAEMTVQTRRNAQNAGSADDIASAAGELATAGDTQIQEMVKAMAELDEASQNISKIIKVIEEIAFQTNLLALNAAVEAARAGTHGKGFAVVAEEVRNLASRSAGAAKETTALIESTLKKVEHGTVIANKTADALTQIVKSVGEVQGLVTEIARASEDQAEGIAQINDGLKQVDQVTQTNTAAAEQCAAASTQLNSQVEQLRSILTGFKMRETQQDPLEALANLSPQMLATLQQFLTQNGARL